MLRAQVVVSSDLRDAGGCDEDAIELSKHVAENWSASAVSRRGPIGLDIKARNQTNRSGLGLRRIRRGSARLSSSRPLEVDMARGDLAKR